MISLLKSTAANGSSLDQVFEKLVTKKQLAAHLEVSESFINKLMKLEGLPYITLGRAVRFRILEVAEWLQPRSRP